MADDKEDRRGGSGSDSSSDSESGAKTAKLMRKIEFLEKEKSELLSENEDIKAKFEDMVVEIGELRNEKKELNDKLGAMRIEIEVEEEGKNAMESIAARAADLEVEVSQLQHDLISAMSEGEEANLEIIELKKALGEKEEAAFHLEKKVEEMRKAKADSDKFVREMERKIGVLEMRESEGKSEKTRVEQGMREKFDEKEVELLGHKRKVEDLEFVIARNGAELAKCEKEKKNMGKALRMSGEKARAMELKMVHMQKEVGEAEQAIRMLKEKTVESVNVILDGEMKSRKARWSSLVAIGSAGAVVAIAVAVRTTSAKGGRG